MSEPLERLFRREKLTDTTQEWMLVTHGLGVMLVGSAFLVDYSISHRLERSAVYGPLVDNHWIGWPWLIAPFLGGILVLAGVMRIGRYLRFTGLAVITLWYAWQCAVLTLATLDGRTNLLAPCLLYAAILFPISIGHLISIAVICRQEAAWTSKTQLGLSSSPSALVASAAGAGSSTGSARVNSAGSTSPGRLRKSPLTFWRRTKKN